MGNNPENWSGWQVAAGQAAALVAGQQRAGL
jgi:hypothetical protein